jgi:hypothetical protein
VPPQRRHVRATHATWWVSWPNQVVPHCSQRAAPSRIAVEPGARRSSSLVNLDIARLLTPHRDPGQ